MKLDDLKFTFKELLLIIGFVVGVVGSWYDIKLEINELKNKIVLLEKQTYTMNARLQWLLGEAIRSGWQPPIYFDPKTEENQND